MMNIQFIEGERANSYIYHCGDGHHYHYNNCNNYGENEGNASTLYMRCKNHYSKGCPGTAAVHMNDEGAQWTNTHRHTCTADRYYERVLLLRKLIIAESKQQNGPYETPTELVERIRNEYVIILKCPAL